MKQCKECGALSSDETVFCYICGMKFQGEEESQGQISQYEENIENSNIQNSFASRDMETTGFVNNRGLLNARLRFDGVYSFEFPLYSSYLRFFSDGKVVGMSIQTSPQSAFQYLRYDYDENMGMYKIDKGLVEFDLYSKSGRVNYRGRLLPNGNLSLYSTSYINGNKSCYEYKFVQINAQ